MQIIYFLTFCLTARSHLVESPPTYNSEYNYKSWEAYSNLSYYTRTLPPLPRDCPTPDLPNPKEVVEKVLLRKQFVPDPQGTSLMFAFFAQHFSHQFFKSDFKKGPAFTKALGHGVSIFQRKFSEILYVEPQLLTILLCFRWI